jgi:hypothetical protein
MKYIDLFEMANLGKKITGLPLIVYISTETRVKHIPRLKVMKNNADHFDPNNMFSVFIKLDITQDDIVGYSNLPTNILLVLKNFININYHTLILYWNNQITTKRMKNSIKSINKI